MTEHAGNDKRTGAWTPAVHWGHPAEHIPLFVPPQTPSGPLAWWWLLVGLVLAVGAGLVAWQLEHLGATAVPPIVASAWMIPLATLLLCIALMPFIARHFWEKWYPAVSLGLGAIVVAYYLLGLGLDAGGRNVARSLGEYISFVFLLGSLFTVSGGILIRVRRPATPMVNATLLLTGALLANVFGTTGAAMLLIRPYLRINQARPGGVRPYHIVFFIFLVANVGGALTPIGDPPLFLGYLKGVPFWWVAQHCWTMWATAVGLLLTLFVLLDWWHSRSPLPAPTPASPEAEPETPEDLKPIQIGVDESSKDPPMKEPTSNSDRHLGPPISIYGAGNLLFIVLILLGVFQSPPWREILMALAAIGSLWTTAHRIHVENVFNFAPIREVALLFLGIFATMVPALNYLANNAQTGQVARLLSSPGRYYYTTGTLSSILDNAPTYLTFLESELGKVDPTVAQRLEAAVKHPNKPPLQPEDLAGLTKEQTRRLWEAMEVLTSYHGDRARTGTLNKEEIRVGILIADPQLNAYLVAISLGAVFFGACTYIGNGPNFMVKSIAEHAGVFCPSFFGYILCYTLPILLPTLVVVWAVFLRH